MLLSTCQLPHRPPHNAHCTHGGSSGGGATAHEGGDSSGGSGGGGSGGGGGGAAAKARRGGEGKSSWPKAPLIAPLIAPLLVVQPQLKRAMQTCGRATN